MNWQLLGSLLIVLVIFLSSLVALIAYIRHWASRQELFKPTRETEGLYFKRYIPPSLYLEYDKEKLRRDSFYLHYIKSIKITLFVIVIGLSVSVLFAFLYINRDRFVSAEHMTKSKAVVGAEIH